MTARQPLGPDPGAVRARWAMTAVYFTVGLLLSAWFTRRGLPAGLRYLRALRLTGA